MARKPDTAAALEQARVTLREIEAHSAELAGKRRSRLLAGDGAAEIAALDTEMEKLQHAAATERDRIVLLEQEAERQANERRTREKQALIERIEKKLAARDEAGAELQVAIKKCDEAFRKIVALSRECDAAWPWPASDRIPALLPPGAIARAVRHEIFRVGSRPRLFGGVDGADAGLDYPGGQSPNLQLTGLPEKVSQLIDVFKDATQFASEILRNGKVAEAPTLTGVSTRSSAQEQLGKLLVRQAELAADQSTEGEQAYLAVCEQVAIVSAEVEATTQRV